MKAWHVSEDVGDGGSTIVFAETRGKAHQLAMGTDTCEGAEWNDVRVVRAKAFDEYYTEGKHEMDWDNKEDRIVLVKHGWSCLEPDWTYDCKFCAAQEWCGTYQDHLADKEE